MNKQLWKLQAISECGTGTRRTDVVPRACMPYMQPHTTYRTLSFTQWNRSLQSTFIVWMLNGRLCPCLSFVFFGLLFIHVFFLSVFDASAIYAVYMAHTLVHGSLDGDTIREFHWKFDIFSTLFHRLATLLWPFVVIRVPWNEVLRIYVSNE